jgi:DNA-binding NtrC family response regulator
MMNLFIVDDEPHITTMLQKALSRNRELSVRTFNNPVLALEQLASTKPDLILLDIMMPQMDGIEVLSRIKKQGHTINVLMMTAYSTLDRVLECHKLGAEDYLLKPFESLKDVENKILKVGCKSREDKK